MLGRLVCEVFSHATTKCALVSIGDLADMTALGAWDKPGSRSFEGRRYFKDLEVCWDAQRKIFDEIDAYNRPRRGNAKLDIEFYWTLGNHEARIGRLLESDPTRMEGIVSYDQLTNEGEFPWKVIPFLEPFFLAGVGYQHFWTSGVMSRAIGGEHQAATILRKQMQSCVQGHTHTLDMASRTRADGKKITAAVVGCYFTHIEEWAGPANALWDPGIAVLHCKDGEFDFSWYSWRRIVDDFG